MAYYISRDYVPATTGYTLTFGLYYLASIFLRRVMGFTVVGQTGTDLDSGTLLLASGLVADGYGAGINASGTDYKVLIPISVRTVSAGDINKIIVLKSTTNPTKNAGLFKINGFNAGDNSYTIDYRTAGADYPPQEVINSMDWYLYEAENVVSNAILNLNTPDAVNFVTGAGYTGDGASTANRIILQSPHASGWQVRIAHEPQIHNAVFNTYYPAVSFAVGFGGNSSGDFAVGGLHTHIPQYLNITPVGTSVGYANMIPGGGTTIGTQRWSFFADDTGESCIIVGRSVSGSVNHMINFGIPENEPVPTPSSQNRLYCYGTNSIGAATGDIYFRLLGASAYVGNAIDENIPILCALTGWTYLDTNISTYSPIYESTAGDCPFINSTELLPVEVWSGTYITPSLTLPAPNILQFNQRYMGTARNLMIGRTNFGDYTLTTDPGRSWMHLRNGIYIKWGGPTTL